MAHYGSSFVTVYIKNPEELGLKLFINKKIAVYGEGGCQIYTSSVVKDNGVYVI